MHSALNPEIVVVADSGPSREAEQVHPPLSIPSPPPTEKPDSTWTHLIPLLALIVPPDNADTSAIPDHTSEDLRPKESAEPSPAANEDKSNWRSTASATAKLLLRGVRDSADAFGPLKSVAGGLCFILENCEV